MTSLALMPALRDLDLLAAAIGGRNGPEIALWLLREHGSVFGVAQAHPAVLAQAPGLGTASATKLHAALNAGLRAQRPEGPVSEIRTAKDAWLFFAPYLRGRQEEEFHGVFLTGRSRVIAHRALTKGSHRVTTVDPAYVMREAVSLRAAYFVVAHNHPSGDPTPSEQDVDVTRILASAGKTLGIPLVDHLVIADTSWVSIQEDRPDAFMPRRRASWPKRKKTARQTKRPTALIASKED